MTTEMLPARINLQIREGIQNELARFEVAVAQSRPNTETGLIDHDVDITTLIGGIAMAMRDQIDSYVNETTAPDEARQWLESIRDWIFEDVA